MSTKQIQPQATSPITPLAAKYVEIERKIKRNNRRFHIAMISTTAAAILYAGIGTLNMAKNEVKVPYPVLIEKHDQNACSDLSEQLRKNVFSMQKYSDKTSESVSENLFLLRNPSKNANLNANMKSIGPAIVNLKAEAKEVSKACKTQGISFEVNTE